MNKIQTILSEKQILIGDGAWGTLFQNAGLTAGACPELWNLEKRETVLKIARSYSSLNIDILETNSFGGTSFMLDAYGLANRAYVLNRAAAEISVHACKPGQVVMASMGPTGKMLMMGDISAAQMYEAFAEQARALQDGGADAIIVETMSDLEEAGEAIRAVKTNTDLEIVCSFTFDRTANGEFRTMMGLSPVQVASELMALKVPVIGTNCGSGLERMIPILKEIHKAYPEIPLLVNANAGIPVVKNGVIEYEDTPEKMAAFVPDVIAAGARLIGGCCGTTPEHIKAIKEAVENHMSGQTDHYENRSDD